MNELVINACDLKCLNIQSNFSEYNKLIKNLTENRTPQGLLLQYIKEDDEIEVKYLLEETGVDINYLYPEFGNKNALQVACAFYSNETSEKCIKLLLESGIDIEYEEPEMEKNALHFAAEGNNCKILKTILDYIKKKKIDISNSNVIFMLIKYISDRNANEENYVDIIKLLLTETNIYINYEDKYTGCTAIHMAAKYEYKRIVETIIDVKKNEIDLDEFTDKTGKSARDLIIEKDLCTHLPVVIKDESPENLTIVTLYKIIRKHNCTVKEFKEKYEHIKCSISEDEQISLLDMAIKFRLEEIVKLIIINMKDKTDPLSEKEIKSLVIACQRGYPKILEIFKGNRTISDSQLELLIFELFKSPYFTKQNTKFKQCIANLYKEKDCNYYDIALHFAVKYQEPEMALEYLQKGAKLVSRNANGRLAINDIDSDTLEQHLNKCIRYEEKIKINRDSCLVINLYSLLPINELYTQQNTNNTDDTLVETTSIPRNIRNDESNEDGIELQNIEFTTNESTLTPILGINNTQINITDDVTAEKFESGDEIGTERGTLTGNQKSPQDKYFPETEVIQNMCTDELRKHLKHPVVSVFLFLKWKRVHCFLLINLIFYLIFAIILLLNIYLGLNNKTIMHEYNGTSMILIILLLILIIREIFQLYIFKFNYFNSENLIEIVLMIATGGILATYSNEVLMRQCSAVAIVAAAIEFLLLIGKFYCASYMVMLRTVSWVFFKLFIFYSVLLVAFAYSFHILFQETNTEITSNNNNDTKCNNTDDDFFENIGISILKTIVMLTGEFEASGLKFKFYPHVSYILFVIFVFLIAIVLYNLLNGLAVSDTQMIKNDAELYNLEMRVTLVEKIEKIFLKCLHLSFYINIPSCLLGKLKKCFIFSTNVKKMEIKIYPYLDWKVKVNGENMGKLDKKMTKEIMKLMKKLRTEKLRQKKENDITRDINILKNQLRTKQYIESQKKACF